MSSKPRGMTLIGFLIVLVLVLFVAYLGMKIAPIYLNHYSVVDSMRQLAKEPGIANMPENRIRDMLSRKFTTSYVSYISARDVRIERSTQVSVVAEYEVREGLIGNMDVVVSFKRVQPLN